MGKYCPAKPRKILISPKPSMEPSDDETQVQSLSLDSQQELDRDDSTGHNQRQCPYCWWPTLRRPFRHPYLRCFVATFIALMNFLIYAEDPIAHSRVEATIPVIGNDLGMIFTQYPESPSYIKPIKALFVIVFVLGGMVIGRQVVHKRILSPRYKMFAEEKGTWMIMFWTTLIVLYIGTSIYNFVIKSIDEKNEAFQVDQTFSLTNEDFMKIAASGTWMGDYITAYMVIDMMLQDDEYPKWAVGLRSVYKQGRGRIIAFWCITITLCVTVITCIATDAINWDEYGDDLNISTTEFGRAFLASVITAFDLCIVMQDWEFPTFVTNQDIKLPGLDVTHIKFDLWEWIGHVIITGKWFNYGIIFMVMLLDLNMLKNQVAYRPEDFGQYTGPDDHIYTITNQADLAQFLADPTSANFTYQARLGKGDLFMNAKYKGFSAFVLGLTIIPAAAAGLMFFVLFRLEDPLHSTHEDGGVDSAEMKRRLSVSVQT